MGHKQGGGGEEQYPLSLVPDSKGSNKYAMLLAGQGKVNNTLSSYFYVFIFLWCITLLLPALNCVKTTKENNKGRRERVCVCVAERDVVLVRHRPFCIHKIEPQTLTRGPRKDTKKKNGGWGEV